MFAQLGVSVVPAAIGVLQLIILSRVHCAAQWTLQETMRSRMPMAAGTTLTPSCAQGAGQPAGSLPRGEAHWARCSKAEYLVWRGVVEDRDIESMLQ